MVRINKLNRQGTCRRFFFLIICWERKEGECGARSRAWDHILCWPYVGDGMGAREGVSNSSFNIHERISHFLGCEAPRPHITPTFLESILLNLKNRKRISYPPKDIVIDLQQDRIYRSINACTFNAYFCGTRSPGALSSAKLLWLLGAAPLTSPILLWLSTLQQFLGMSISRKKYLCNKTK